MDRFDAIRKIDGGEAHRRLVRNSLHGRLCALSAEERQRFHPRQSECYTSTPEEMTARSLSPVAVSDLHSPPALLSEFFVNALSSLSRRYRNWRLDTISVANFEKVTSLPPLIRRSIK